MSAPEPAATAPGRPLGDDWPAIAAHAAHHDIIAPAEALASWHALDEDRRVAWRASADAVQMLLDAKPALELAETRRMRDVVCKLIDLFSQPDGRRMRHASVTAATIERYAAEAGVKP